VWTFSANRRLTIKAGVVFDDTNRDPSAVSPSAGIALDEARSAAARIASSQLRRFQPVPTYTALNSSPTVGAVPRQPQTSGAHPAAISNWAATRRGGAWQTHVAAFNRRDDRLVTGRSSAVWFARTANPVDIDTAGAEATLRWSATRCDLVLATRICTSAPTTAPPSWMAVFTRSTFQGTG